MPAIPVSTIPACKAYLLALLTTAVNDPAVLVCYGPPGIYFPDDIIYIGDADRTIRPLGMVGGGGPGAFLEEYIVRIMLRSFRAGGGEQAVVADGRAWQLVGIIDTAIRGDMTFGGLLIEGAPDVQTSTLDFDPDHKGWESAVVYEVRCTASN